MTVRTEYFLVGTLHIKIKLKFMIDGLFVLVSDGVYIFKNRVIDIAIYLDIDRKSVV